VLEPQGTLFFLLLMVAFGALLVWLVLTRQVVFRVLAACLAFIPAMVFGIAAVNKYYDYYQTWGALFSDLSGQAQSVPHLAAAGLKRGAGSLQEQIASSSNAALDAQFGDLFSTTVTGPHSHITRQVYVYLPPQYFQKAYANYRFPAIELLHGAPGEPSTWVNVMNVIPIYLNLLAERKAYPAVLVMPDTDGGLQYSLQCLNDPHGLQDMTYVGQEVPNWAAANLRVQRPGGTWGITGYSEGGFCAANIGLQYATRYGYVGVESGYFAPDPSQVPAGGKARGKPVDINVFARNKRLLDINTPDQYIKNIPVGITVPQFYLAAGAEDVGDVQAAEYFRQLLLLRVANVPPVDIVPGAGHQALVWRSALTPILEWMTSGLATEIQRLGMATVGAPTTPAHHSAAPKVVHPPASPAHSPLPRPTALSGRAVRRTAPPQREHHPVRRTSPGRRRTVAGQFPPAGRLIAHASPQSASMSAGRDPDGRTTGQRAAGKPGWEVWPGRKASEAGGAEGRPGGRSAGRRRSLADGARRPPGAAAGVAALSEAAGRHRHDSADRARRGPHDGEPLVRQQARHAAAPRGGRLPARQGRAADRHQPVPERAAPARVPDAHDLPVVVAAKPGVDGQPQRL